MFSFVTIINGIKGQSGQRGALEEYFACIGLSGVEGMIYISFWLGVYQIPIDCSHKSWFRIQASRSPKNTVTVCNVFDSLLLF